MGQNQSQVKGSEDYSLVEELPIGNIVKHHKTGSLHFLKEYSFTAQEAYQNALNMHSLKLANKNEHILNFQHFTTKSENSFCSTFHKIVLIFEYIDDSLEAEMTTRLKEQRPFTEKEMWSVLCSCVLAAVHLIHTEGRMHCGLTSKDIRLTSSGCVKLFSLQMIGIDKSHTQSEGKPKMLAITLIECLLLEKLTNQSKDYLEGLIQNMECSRDMKEILTMMVSRDIKFTELEEHLFKLVQDDESLASHSNTPILKAQSPINSNYKCPRICRNDLMEEKGTPHVKQIKQVPLLFCEPDYQDYQQYAQIMSTHLEEVENPDETDSDNQAEIDSNTNRGSPQKINSFFLRERKIEDNVQSKPSVEKTSTFQYGHTTQSYELQRPHYEPYSYEKSFQPERKQEKPSIVQHQTNVYRQEYQHQQNHERKQEFKQQTKVEFSYQNGQIQETKTQYDHLFTDPKLFSLIRNDLQEIKMRKSNADLAATHEQSKPSWQANSYSAVSHLEKKVLEESSSVYDLKNQIIRECSQESKEEDQQVSSMVSPLSQVDNIMKDPDLGFKKKNPDSKRQSENVQTIHYKKETTPTSIYENILSTAYPDKRPNPASQTKSSSQQSQSGRAELFNKYANPTSSQRDSEQEKEQLVTVSEKYTRGKYEGTKLNGKRHGFGTFYYSEGGRYVGNWVQNKMHGKGTLYYPNQKIAYEGHWENDQLSGYGVLYNQEVTPLRNPFDYRDFSDVEDYWTKYEGNFSADNKQGKGKLFLVNGQRLEATFHDDKVDGEGVLYRGDGTFVKGKWRQNQLVGLF